MVKKVSSPVKQQRVVTAGALVTPPKRDRPGGEEEAQRAALAERDAKVMKTTPVGRAVAGKGPPDLDAIFVDNVVGATGDGAARWASQDAAPTRAVVLDENEVEDIDDDEDMGVKGMRRPDANISYAAKPTLVPLQGTALLNLSSRPQQANYGHSTPPRGQKFLQNHVSGRTYGKKLPAFGSTQYPMTQQSMHHFSSSSSPGRQFAAPRRLMPEGAVGLRNLGNFCYMNASLQAVLVFEALVREVCDEALVRRVQAGMAEGKEPLCSVLRKFWLEAQAASGQVLSAARIKAVIESSNAQFVGNDQEDAHEFFSTFINLLEDEYRETTKEEQGPVFGHFSLSIQHTLACQECGQGRSFEEPFLDLSLEHVASDEAVPVSVLLEHFMQTERDLEWKCPLGCTGGRATLAHCMARSPRILLLQVKRFATSEDGRSFFKIKNPVQVPEYLDVTPVMQQQQEGAAAQGYLYQLRAVVVHRGETIRGGHYICFARKDEQWLRYNDAVVDKCTSREAFEGYEAQRDAYMLFYSRMDAAEN
jgi:ubiquitin C-terminal hydrolase